MHHTCHSVWAEHTFSICLYETCSITWMRLLSQDFDHWDQKCGFLKPLTAKWKSKGQDVIAWDLSHMYPDYFCLCIWPWMVTFITVTASLLSSLLSLIGSIQGLERLALVRLPALKPLLAPGCGPPPPSWACWILKASRRFWARTSLLWISSTTRLGNQPLSPSWSLSPIIQPGIHRKIRRRKQRKIPQP